LVSQFLESPHLRIFLHDYGGYAFTAQLGRALAKKGHQVLYSYSLTTQLIQRFNLQPELDNFTIEGVSLPKPFTRYNYLRRWRDERVHGRKVAQQVRDFRPDVVLSANTPLDAQKLILNGSREVGAKFIFWMQDAIGLATKNALSYRYPLFGRLIGDHYIRLERELVSASDKVVIISEGFLDSLQGWGIDEARTRVIPNWAPLDEIPIMAKDNRWTQSHDLTDKFVFLFSGVLGLKHDARLFIELAQAFNQYPDVRIVVVAEGPFAESLKSESEVKNLTNLVILPYQPPDDYPQMLACADVLMTILRTESSVYSVPSKVYTHMCASRSQLLSIPAGNPVAKLVTEQKMGLVSEPDDMHTWLENAFALYQNRYNNQQMGMNARAYAEEHFDIDIIVNKFEALMVRGHK